MLFFKIVVLAPLDAATVTYSMCHEAIMDAISIDGRIDLRPVSTTRVH